MSERKNQDPNEKFEAGHEPGEDAVTGVFGSVLGNADDATKQTIADAVVRDATGTATDETLIKHGIANLTSPMPAATDFELAAAPDVVAEKQAEAVSQTAVGQALASEGFDVGSASVSEDEPASKPASKSDAKKSDKK